MPTVYRFNTEGEFIGLDFVDESYEPGELEAVVADGVEVNFHKLALRDGQLVEGLTPEEIAERENQVPEVPKDPVYEKLETIEQQMQSDNLATFDVLATLYSEVAVGSLSQMEVMATMYAEILTLRAEVEALKGGAV